MAFAFFGLAMTWVQEVMSPSLQASADFYAAQRAQRTVWRLHLPIWFVGGIGLVVCGLRLRGLRRHSVALARFVCVLALMAMTIYVVDVWERVLPAMEPLFARPPFLPGGSFRLFGAVSAVGSLLMVAAPFCALLWGLRARAER